VNKVKLLQEWNMPTSSKLMAFFVILAVAACPTISSAQTTTTPTFQMLSVPFGGIEVSGIAATAANNIWTVSGSLVTQSNVNASTSASLNFNGTQFAETPFGSTVAGTAQFLNAVAAISPTDVWSVGFDAVINGPLEVVQHFDGTKWQEVKDVAMVGKGDIFGEKLNAISAVSSDDVFVAGNLYNFDSEQVLPFFEHWDGQAWSQAGPSPTVSASQTYINGIAALSSTDVWAVGWSQILVNGPVANGATAPAAFHFDGTKWTEIPGADCICGFTAVTAIAPDDVWAVGFLLSEAGGSFSENVPMAQHWNGTNWTVTPVPAPIADEFIQDQLFAVAAVSSKSVWAVGAFPIPSGNGFDAEIDHWDGTKWSVVTPPPCPSNQSCGLFSVTALPTGQVWAGGAVSPTFSPGQKGGVPLILFTNQGK
jgi:hypothetical protein